MSPGAMGEFIVRAADVSGLDKSFIVDVLPTSSARNLI